MPRAAQDGRPAAGHPLSPAGPLLIPALVLIAARAWMWKLLPFASEDAYITFRYARSLAGGHGLVFNPGERVMGFSSPLWTAWSAAGIALLHDPVPWTRASSLAADLATLFLFGRLLERHDSKAAAWCFAAYFAAWPFFAAVSASGMESSAMLALIAIAATAIERRHAAAGPVLGALALVRPEGVVAAAVLAWFARGRDRAVGAAIALLGWGALALYFGSLVPQSLLAKSSLYGTPGPWAGRFWWDWLLPLPRSGGRIAEAQAYLVLIVVLTPAAVIGARALWRSRRSALAAAVAALLAIWFGYAALGVAYFNWYFVPPAAAAGILAAIGMPRVTRGVAVPAMAGLLLLGSWNLARPLYVGRAQNEAAGFGGAASYLSAVASPGQKVFLEPIGMVGWTCPLVVVDEVGLVSPRVARRRMGGPGWYADIVEAEKPDWLVTRKLLFADGGPFAGAGAPFRTPAERDSLLARYAIATAIDTTSGPNSLLVLRRAR